MDKILSFEQLRLIAVSAFSSLIAIFTPTKGFVFSLVVMFAFNIFAGMRADGITIVRCHNFKMKKFRGALAELFIYLLIIETLQVILVECGDGDTGLIIVKSITYVFLYVYLCNAFRNLIIAYPNNAALRIVYHLIRLEFTRMLPDSWKPIVERYTKKENSEPSKKEDSETTKTK